MAAGRPARWWGWHQLDASWADRLVADAQILPGDLVLDVGAGTGALTEALLDRGAQVIAIELHPGRLLALRERFAGRPVKVVRADAADLRMPRRPFRVVANPPFALTTALLRRLLSSGSRLTAADLVLPVHVVRRWSSTSAPGAGRWTSVFELRPGQRVPASAFRPAAPAPCRVLAIRRRA